MRIWTEIPKDVTCSKCGKPIAFLDGRRFRMKYRHYHCLPDTRLRKITDGFKEAKRTKEKYKEVINESRGGWLILYEENGIEQVKEMKETSGGEALKHFREIKGKVKILSMMERDDNGKEKE